MYEFNKSPNQFTLFMLHDPSDFSLCVYKAILNVHWKATSLDELVISHVNFKFKCLLGKSYFIMAIALSTQYRLAWFFFVQIHRNAIKTDELYVCKSVFVGEFAIFLARKWSKWKVRMLSDESIVNLTL